MGYDFKTVGEPEATFQLSNKGLYQAYEWMEELEMIEEAEDPEGGEDPAGERTGILAYKLQSNDNWTVTPQEIAAALNAGGDAAGDDLASEHDESWWGDWIDFLEQAQEAGGFVVT